MGINSEVFMTENTTCPKERRSLLSILVLNLISLIPWVGFYWRPAGEVASLDGPGTLVLLTVTAIATLIVLPFYTTAAILISSNRLSRHVRGLSGLLLITVFTCCVAASYFWIMNGWRGKESVFLLAGILYGTFSLTLIREFTSLCRPNCT